MTSANWDEIESVEALPGILRQVVQGEQQTMVRYRYSPGSVFPVHSHPQEQVTLVISGTIEFTIDGKEITLGPGGVGVIPANVPHGARVVGDEMVETFNALAPRRDTSPGQSTS